jgi:hypothetical protein
MVGPDLLIREGLLLGYSLGVIAGEEDIDVSDQFWRDRRFDHLLVSGMSNLPRKTLLQSKLWSLLRRLAAYQEHSWSHRIEILGLDSEIISFATVHSDEWAFALPWILERAALLNATAESVTVLIAEQTTLVEDALQELCASPEPSELRDRALGIRAMLQGLESPAPGLVRRVMDVVTTRVDGAQVFPHPLELPAATWLGSLGIEGMLGSAVQAAARNFGEFFWSSRGLDEDIHTAHLLDELARSSKASDLSVRALPASSMC